jgi:hypothetical protein
LSPLPAVFDVVVVQFFSIAHHVHVVAREASTVGRVEGVSGKASAHYQNVLLIVKGDGYFEAISFRVDV